MFDLNKEFVNLCEEHNIPCDTHKKNYNLFLDTFEVIWNSIPADETIAFFGGSDGFYQMYNRIKTNPKNLVCVIENFREPSIKDIPVYHINEASRVVTLSNIILTSFRDRKEMAADALKHFPNADIIDVFDVLETRGTPLHAHFVPRKGMSIYRHIYELREKYRACEASEDCQSALLSLIYAYLEMRDFRYAFKYIDEYVYNEYGNFEALSDFKNNVTVLLDSAKDHLSRKNISTVAVFIIDSLTSTLAQNNKFLQDLVKKSLTFTNAYSTGFYTKSATYSYITGKHYVQDNLFRSSAISYEDSEFLRALKQNGIQFKHIGNSYFHFVSGINDYNVSDQYGDTQALLLWSLLCDSLNSENDSIYFIHSQEVHEPFYNGDSRVGLIDCYQAYNDLSDNDKSDGLHELFKHECIQQEDALNYVSSQIDFYTNLFSKSNCSFVITSDHHRDSLLYRLLGNKSTQAETAIPLIISSRYITPGTHAGLYSMIDFHNVLLNLVRKSPPSFPDFPCVVREIEPSYGRDLKRCFNMKSTYGRIELFNDNEKYIFYLNGNDEYYSPPDSMVNVINDKEVQDRVAYYRAIIKDIDTKDIWRFMFTKYPYLLDLHKDEVESLAGEEFFIDK